MSDIEKLQAIRARCVKLLELAGKRTPGKWYLEHNGMEVVRTKPLGGIFVADTYNSANAAFIASCAGQAEAGWRATIAAIDAALAFRKIKFGMDGDCGSDRIMDDMVDAILAAWEGQV